MPVPQLELTEEASSLKLSIANMIAQHFGAFYVVQVGDIAGFRREPVKRKNRMKF